MLSEKNSKLKQNLESLKSLRNVHAFTLIDKFTKEEGEILLTGLQALCRLPIDQHRADRQTGLNTATFISGYRGSPVGGLDLLLQSYQKLLTEHNIVFTPGVNEELAATAVFGSQTANLFPNPRFDGVLGMWYGKAPGLDRSTDAIKHANFAGVGKYGGVLAIAGDDPISKSSTLPSHSEITLYDSYCPILYPGNIQDVVDFGRYGFELSRYSGLWSGFKIVTNVADGFGIAHVSPERIEIKIPDFEFNGKPWQHTQNINLLTPFSLEMEREIHLGRLEAAKRFGTVNELNRITINPSKAWLGIIASGKTYFDLIQSFRDMGLNEVNLKDYGIRVLKLGLLFPLDEEFIQRFAEGLDEILVIEEKRGFIEGFIKDALYHRMDRPNIIGKYDRNGERLVSAYGELDQDDISKILAHVLSRKLDLESITTRIRLINQPTKIDTIPLVPRTPYFCSGCPHNISTKVPEGSMVGAGIGCHTMVLLMPDRPASGITQMGGEGAQWVGASHFTETGHLFQNIGDGTLFHSGTLAIRQTIAAKTDITYKILYNSAVAMTGGQQADGLMAIPELITALRAEGVGQIIVTTEDIQRYANAQINLNNVNIWHRDRLEEAQELLAKTPGVTVLIHDQECAAELRRKRRRGLADDPKLRVVINEAVCEGCGDCGEKSNCLSVFPIQTEFGRKTQIHQASCNKDYTCLKGDCPAFVTIIAEDKEIADIPEYIRNLSPPEPDNIAEFSTEYNIRMMGIGGTGVVTVNQIIATAAYLDGLYVTGLDQTGLSQKGGPVVANLKLTYSPDNCANKVSLKTVDCYLALDALSASDMKNLKYTSPQRTTAVISTSEVPTGRMVKSIDVHYPRQAVISRLIGDNTRTAESFAVDAIRISETLFGTDMQSNILCIGVAYQRGLLPISAKSIERAIELNGVGVKQNIAAFRAGRQVVADPTWLDKTMLKEAVSQKFIPVVTDEVQTMIDTLQPQGELLRILRIRIPELIAYQNKNYATRYVEFVRQVRKAELDLHPDKSQLTEAVARYLFKLMAYKDEYEVSRLQLKDQFHDALEQEFGTNVKIHYMLQPPFLRALGMKKKVKFGRWFNQVYQLLYRLRGLRGTPFDVFGYAKVRRVERQLIDDYKRIIQNGLNDLSTETYDQLVTFANLPDRIRGYEDIKLRNVDQFYEEVRKMRL